MFNVLTQEKKTMEKILIEDYRGNTNAQELEQSLRQNGWRQDRNHGQPINQNQIRRGLRNNALTSRCS